MKIEFETNYTNSSEPIVKISINIGERTNTQTTVIKNFAVPFQPILVRLLDNIRLTVNEREQAEAELFKTIEYLMWPGDDVEEIDQHNSTTDSKDDNEKMIVEKDEQ